MEAKQWTVQIFISQDDEESVGVARVTVRFPRSATSSAPGGR